MRQTKSKLLVKNIKYFVTVVIGLLMSYGVFNYKHLFSVTTKRDLYLVLSDGFILPGVIIFGLGLLTMAANGGMFDIFSFSFGSLKQKLTKKQNRDPNYPTSFFDYRQKYEDRKIPYKFLLIVGGVFLVLSLLFNCLFYTV